MLISNFSNSEILKSVNLNIVFLNLLLKKGILDYLRDFCHLQQNNLSHLCMPQTLIVNLWKVALKLEFQFAPCTTRNFHSTSPVSLSPNCISISSFQCTVGIDVIQGHVHTGDRRARYTQVWTRGHINSYFNQKAS